MVQRLGPEPRISNLSEKFDPWIHVPESVVPRERFPGRSDLGPSILKFQWSNRKWTVMKSQKDCFLKLKFKVDDLNGPYSFFNCCFQIKNDVSKFIMLFLSAALSQNDVSNVICVSNPIVAFLS